MTQTPKVERPETAKESDLRPESIQKSNFRPKIEKKSLWIWFNQHPSPRVLKQADFDMGLNPEFKDQCTEVVEADYVTALETALKAVEKQLELAKNQRDAWIESKHRGDTSWRSPLECEGMIDFVKNKANKALDALAKVDLK